MKITRIDQIKNARILRDFSWTADLLDFGRFNLIYGWNGSGKTTLSELLRHLQTREPLDPGEGEMQIRVDGRPVRGDGLASAVLPPVRVFNRSSVDRSIFEVAGGELPPVYFLGEQSVEKQQQVDALTDDLAEAESELRDRQRARVEAQSDFETFCTSRAREIKNLLTVSGGGPYNNYDARPFKTTAERLIAAEPRPKSLEDAEKSRHLAAKEGTAREKLVLTREWPALGGLMAKVQRILARVVVSDSIPELVADPIVGGWVAAGLPLHTGTHASENCRFCDQPLPSVRLARLQAHFNDQFQRLQADLSSLLARVDSASQDLGTTSRSIPDERFVYPNLAADYATALVAFREQESRATKLVAVCRKALEGKAREPFREIDLSDVLPPAGDSSHGADLLRVAMSQVDAGAATWEGAFGSDALAALAELLDRHNAQTDDFKAQQASARAALEQDAVLAVLATYQARTGAIEATAVQLEQATDTADSLRAQVATLKQAIQQHQRPADELSREMASYLGHSELKFEVQPSGYTITRGGHLALNLSDGERTAIAFMYFLKSLEDTGFNRRGGVVVVDDPVSSLDANSLYSAFGFMKARTQDVGQLFVLTHNFTFFRQVRNWFSHLPGQKKPDPTARPARFYMLTCRAGPAGRQARIEPLDPLLYRYQSEYQYLFECVFKAATIASPAEALSTYYGLPNIGRRLLETFLAFRVPNCDGLAKQLDCIDFDAGKKIRILQFLHTESHFAQVGDPEHDLSLLSEAQSVLQDLMELINQADPGHYAAMVSLIDDQAEQ